MTNPRHGHAPGPMRLELEAVAASAARARRVVADYADQLGARDTWPIAVAVSEAVTNAVLHAYPDEPGQVLVEAEPIAEGGMRVIVEDRGVGMRARADSPGAGLGLLLLIQTAGSCTIALSAEGGTRVCLDFVF